MSNKHSTITVPTEHITTLNCPSCHASLQYYTIPKQFPHLYCTHCHNAYVDEAAQDDSLRIHTDGGAEKIMSSIHSIAPLCDCGGMFLFNVGAHCVHCGEILPFPCPRKPKHRLLYDQLIVFHNAIIFYNHGKRVTYRLTR